MKHALAITALTILTAAYTHTTTANAATKPGYCTWHPELAACQTDTPVTSATFARVSRILACANRPVPRLGEPDGIAVNLDANQFASGQYAGVRFTIARYYPGIGATCQNLGGTNTGNTLTDYGYPIWQR